MFIGSKFDKFIIFFLKFVTINVALIIKETDILKT